MSRYFVSLAVLRPMNYELTVEAKDEKDAFAMAIDDFYSAEQKGHTDDYALFEDDILNVGAPKEPGGIPRGAYINKEEPV